jgi:hypothetical protein
MTPGYVTFGPSMAEFPGRDRNAPQHSAAGSTGRAPMSHRPRRPRPETDVSLPPCSSRPPRAGLGLVAPDGVIS